MKKNFTILFLLILMVSGFNSYATVHPVTVQDFSFSPSSLAVSVGDTIQWTWVSGSHTTTSITMPVGATPWNASINSGSLSFSYQVTTAGSYTYNCAIHPSLMSGSFTATGTLGIGLINPSAFLLNSTLVSNQLQITYKLENATPVDILLLDVTGKQVKNFSASLHAPGTYSESYSLSNINKGEYLLELKTSDMITTRKIVVQ